MITLLGSLLGFLGSAFPEMLKVYRDSRDQAHELAILDRQMQMMVQGHQQRVEEIEVQADAGVAKALYRHARPVGIRWIDGMAGTVRPVITYAFFLLYAVVKLSQWFIVRDVMGSNWAEAISNIWHMEDQALFATVISFWFGQRMLLKSRQGWNK